MKTENFLPEIQEFWSFKVYALKRVLPAYPTSMAETITGQRAKGLSEPAIREDSNDRASSRHGRTSTLQLTEAVGAGIRPAQNQASRHEARSGKGFKIPTHNSR